MINQQAAAVPVSRSAVQLIVRDINQPSNLYLHPVEFRELVIGLRQSFVFYAHYRTCPNPWCGADQVPDKHQLAEWVQSMPTTDPTATAALILSEHPPAYHHLTMLVGAMGFIPPRTRSILKYYAVLAYFERVDQGDGLEPLADVLGDLAPWVLTEFGPDTSGWEPPPGTDVWYSGAKGFG